MSDDYSSNSTVFLIKCEIKFYRREPYFQFNYKIFTLPHSGKEQRNIEPEVTAAQADPDYGGI